MEEKLALYGGPKAKTTPNIPMYPGGLEIGELEKKEVCEVLDNQYLFRYYGPKNVKSKVRTLEERFMERTGAKYALATSSCTGALISSLVGCGIGNTLCVIHHTSCFGNPFKNFFFVGCITLYCCN